MASKTITVCDVHDDDEVLAVDNVVFEDGGGYFELDLCAVCLTDWKTYEDLRGKFCAAGRRVDRTAVTPEVSRRRRQPDSVSSTENRAIRQWAKEQGMELGDRGRIPEALRRQFRQVNAHRRWDAAASED